MNYPRLDTMTDNLLDKVYLDDVLVRFSVIGRYHAVTIVLLSTALVGQTMCFYNYVFIADNVRYK